MLYPFSDVLPDFSKPSHDDIERERQAKEAHARRIRAEHEAQLAREQEALLQKAKHIQTQQKDAYDYALQLRMRARNKERYQQGYNEATQKEQTQNTRHIDALTRDYQDDFAALKKAFDKENKRRDGVVETLAHLFSRSVGTIVQELLQSPAGPHMKAFENDLCQEAAQLAQNMQEDHVTIECAPAQKARLQTLLGEDGNIEIITSSAMVGGVMHVVSKGHDILLDPHQWQKKVSELVLARVDNVMNQDTTSQNEQVSSDTQSQNKVREDG